MKTLFNHSNIGSLNRWALMAAITLALTACGGGGSSDTPASQTTEERVNSLFAQYDSGTITEDSLLTQLRALGF